MCKGSLSHSRHVYYCFGFSYIMNASLVNAPKRKSTNIQTDLLSTA